MSQHAAVPVSAAEFLAWDLGRPDGPHELVDGVPVPKHWAVFGMVGARGGHDRIVRNLAREIARRHQVMTKLSSVLRRLKLGKATHIPQQIVFDVSAFLHAPSAESEFSNAPSRNDL